MFGTLGAEILRECADLHELRQRSVQSLNPFLGTSEVRGVLGNRIRPDADLKSATLEFSEEPFRIIIRRQTAFVGETGGERKKRPWAIASPPIRSRIEKFVDIDGACGHGTRLTTH